MKCKITNREIQPFMSFGKMPIANGFLKKEDFDNMLLAAKYAPRKNNENMHVRNLACKIDTKNVRLGPQTTQKVYV